MAIEPPETTQDRNRRVALEVNAMTGTTDIDRYLAYFNDDPSWHINRRTLQGRDALVTVNDQIAVGLVGHRDHDDGCLLPRGCQRHQQLLLPLRIPHPQKFITAV